MPRYFYDDEALREGLEEERASDPSFDVEAEFARIKSEDYEGLPYYEPASCALDETQLSDDAKATLVALRALGVEQVLVRYDGGSDEGWAYFERAVTPQGELDEAALTGQLEGGPQGEAPKKSWLHFMPDHEARLTRHDRARYALLGLITDFAQQLLGRGFGTGEVNLEGRFIADLTHNTLTDLPPDEAAA